VLNIPLIGFEHFMENYRTMKKEHWKMKEYADGSVIFPALVHVVFPNGVGHVCLATSRKHDKFFTYA